MNKNKTQEERKMTKQEDYGFVCEDCGKPVLWSPELGLWVCNCTIKQFNHESLYLQ